MSVDGNGAKLAVRDHAVNAFQAGLLAVPVIGASLEKLMFGSLAELRLKRVEQTLHEVGEAIGRIEGKSPLIDGNEDYAKLLEAVIPSLGRSTRKNKRERFRDLLTKAAFVPEGSNEWDGIDMAYRLIDELDEPCLELLSLAYHLPDDLGDHEPGWGWFAVADLQTEITLSRAKYKDINKQNYDQIYSCAYDNQVGRSSVIVRLANAVINESLYRLTERRVVESRKANEVLHVFRMTELGHLLAKSTISGPPPTA